jgi:hypothetical protein
MNACVLGNLTVLQNVYVTKNGYFANVYSGYSDDRIKENKEPIYDCLSKIQKINPFSFYPNVSFLENIGIEMPYEQDIGLSAQELLPIFPQLICPSWLYIHTNEMK